MKIHVYANWHYRLETSTTAATRLVQLLQRLEQIDPSIGGWLGKADRKKDAFKPWVEQLTVETVREKLESSFDPTFPSGGYTADAWNGEDKSPQASFRVKIGRPDDAYVPNHFALTLKSKASANAMTSDAIKAIVTAIAEELDPQYVVVHTEDFLKAFAPSPDNRMFPPTGGHFLYLSNDTPPFYLPKEITATTMPHGTLYAVLSQDGDYGPVEIALQLHDAILPVRAKENEDNPQFGTGVRSPPSAAH